MQELRTITRLTIGLGVVSVVAILASHLALTDIWHGEGDLTLEWRVLQIGFGAIVLFHVAAFVTLHRLKRHIQG